jgi:hypothetical protein
MAVALDRRRRHGGKLTMAYIFHENELPSLISEVPGRERIFFVNQELALESVSHIPVRLCHCRGDG